MKRPSADRVVARAPPASRTGRASKGLSSAVRWPSSVTRRITWGPTSAVSIRQVRAEPSLITSVTASRSSAASREPAGPSGSVWPVRAVTSIPAASSMARAVVISGASDVAR